MKFHPVLSLLAAAALLSAPCAHGRQASATSPSGNIAVHVSDESEGLTFDINHRGTVVLKPSPIALIIDGQKPATKIKSVKIEQGLREQTASPLYRQSSIDEPYTAMTLTLDDKTQVQFRLFDQGVAYRFATSRRGQITIADEVARYNFPADLEAWLPYSTNDKKPFAMAFQNYYDHTPLSGAKDKYAFLPATVDYGQGLKLTLTESDLEAYPGMYVKADTVGLALQGTFPRYPAATDYYPWRAQKYVTATEPYIARVDGTRTYPWRVLAITESDTQMPVNNLVYALAAPSRIADTSWIKPGKVAWDWWNDWGLTGVPFKAGINMPTYKYYIDFAAANGLQYIILDEGWYDPKSGDMLTVIPDLDLQQLVDYGKAKGVDIVLWTVFNVLDEQLEAACQKYGQMGIKGFKVDFLDRDDQTALEMAYRIAEVCARHKLLLDYHGYFKPTGLNRTYPNVINFEAVFGMEEMKWSEPTVDMPMYDVTFPFVRLLAGPVDYTPGAMRNATKTDWKAVYYNPMSQGTRCHQLATYIVYDSPFTMLCDAPTNYAGSADCVKFIASVPDVVDETRVLSGELGKYIVTARRRGNEWWIGGLTNWDARQLTVDLSFLPQGNYQMLVFADGPNAGKNAQDYAVSRRVVTNANKYAADMAGGGGFAIRLTPLR